MLINQSKTPENNHYFIIFTKLDKELHITVIINMYATNNHTSSNKTNNRIQW